MARTGQPAWLLPEQDSIGSVTMVTLVNGFYQVRNDDWKAVNQAFRQISMDITALHRNLDVLLNERTVMANDTETALDLVATDTQNLNLNNA